MTRVVGVVGARGGAWASSFAALLAAGLRRRGATVLVDLARAGGGLDVALGIEDVDGLRWPDLVDARGELPTAELTALLPRWSGVAVLSADRSRPGAPPSEAVPDVLAALAAEHAVVLLDLDRGDVMEASPPLRICDTVLVVAPRDLAGAAGAVALRPGLAQAVVDVRLVTRGPAPGGLGGLELAEAVDLPWQAELPTDRGMAAAVERGGGPDAGRRLGRVVRGVAEGLW